MKKSQGVNNNNNNNCNCETKIDCPVNSICNLKNVVYQATILPKENVKDKKKIILELCWLDGS